MESQILSSLIQNGPWCLVSGLALYGFYKYILSKDKEKEADKKEIIKIYESQIKKNSDRENRYIEIIGKFGDELSIVKNYCLEIKRKLEIEENE